jgi:hypothetical protein
LTSWEGQKVEGTYQGVNDGLLHVSLEGRADPLEVSLDEVRELEVFEGTRRNALMGFLIGGGTGVAFGVMVGLGAGDDDEDCRLLCYSAAEPSLRMNRLGGYDFGVSVAVGWQGAEVAPVLDVGP